MQGLGLPSSPLRAGAAEVDISPPLGTHLAGAIHLYRPAEALLDPLFAKALVLEANGRRVAVVVLDVVIATERHVEQIRRSVAARYGFDPDAVLIHATQTHSSPALGHFMLSEEYFDLPEEWTWLRGGDDAFHARAVGGAVEAVGRAMEALEPVQIGMGSGIEGRLAHNRRMVMRDGSISMPRGGGNVDPRSRVSEGPMDHELGTICLRRPDGQMLAIVVSYTAHPVNLYPRPVISADWSGAVCHELRQVHGPRCVAMVLNGPCGNVNPMSLYHPDLARGDHLLMGRLMAESANTVIRSLAYRDDAVLDWRAEHLRLPLRPLDPEELARARRIVADQPYPAWADAGHWAIDLDWMFAAALVDVSRRLEHESDFDYDIRVLRLADAALVGLPGEPFVESALQIKLGSPTFPTYVVHNTKFAGYIPTKQAFERGGYETKTWNSGKFRPGALELISETAIRTVRSCFGVAG